MGLLDKLWDDVVAGPQPDQGLGRLRRKPRAHGEAMDDIETPGRIMVERPRRRSTEFIRPHEDARWVTQSIAIAKRPPRLLLPTDSFDPDSTDCGSTPSTPGAPNTPGSSFVGSPFSSFERDRHNLKSVSVPSSPALGSHGGQEREHAWSNMFHQSGNPKPMKKFGSEKLDKQPPNSPTVYDWVVLSALDR